MGVRVRPVLLRTLLALAFPPVVGAQGLTDLVVGGGIGGTYYCIVTRCDTGATLVATVGYGPAPFLLTSVGVRRHDCFDCDRFVIAEGSVQLRRPGGTLQPFLAAGAGVSSDPGSW